MITHYSNNMEEEPGCFVFIYSIFTDLFDFTDTPVRLTILG
jgi:hypothetical protein